MENESSLMYSAIGQYQPLSATRTTSVLKQVWNQDLILNPSFRGNTALPIIIKHYKISKNTFLTTGMTIVFFKDWSL